MASCKCGFKNIKDYSECPMCGEIQPTPTYKCSYVLLFMFMFFIFANLVINYWPANQKLTEENVKNILVNKLDKSNRKVNRIQKIQIITYNKEAYVYVSIATNQPIIHSNNNIIHNVAQDARTIIKTLYNKYPQITAIHYSATFSNPNTNKEEVIGNFVYDRKLLKAIQSNKIALDNILNVSIIKRINLTAINYN